MTKEPSYIRCIKPNHLKQSGIFARDVIHHQVQYLGLIENLRVRRAGFAYRRNYNEFLGRYKSLSPATWPFYPGPSRDGVKEVLLHQGCSPDEFRMGKTKVFIRYAKTLFYLEDKFQARKHELATLIQSRWRGLMQLRKYQEMRAAAIVMEKWIRRHLAKKCAHRRRAAAKVVRGFIKGFITRHDAPTNLNHRFIQTTKAHFLIRLSKSLPKNVLDRSWPKPPKACEKASGLLRVMHLQHMVGRYCKSLSAERKAQMDLKVIAESLFKGKKKSYQSSIANYFKETRLVENGNALKKQFFATEASGQTCKYSTTVTKFDRHGYKRRDRILLLTESNLYLTEQTEKKYIIKHKFPLEFVLKLEVTSERDNFLLVRISPELKEKGDLILEIPNIIEFVTIFADITKNMDSVNITNLIDGKITFSFDNGKEKVIDLTLGMNGPSIMKGQQGQLVVVG